MIAGVAALAVGFGIVSFTATTANAALPGGITQAQIVMPGADPATVVQPGDELPQGQALQLRVSYDVAARGTTVDFKLGDNANLANLTGLDNNGVEKYEIVDGTTVRVTFKSVEDWPDGLTAGVFRLDFKINDDAGPGSTPIGWEVGTENVGVTIDITDPNPPKPPVTVTENYGKSVSPANIDNQVDYVKDGDGNWRFGGLKDSILDQVITYTLTVDVPNGFTGTIPVADRLPAGLQYVDAAGAPVATGGTVPVTVGGKQWDPAGTASSEAPAAGAFTPTVGADGRSFSGNLTASGAAKLTLTYKVKITDKSAVEGLLEASQPAAGGTGGFAAALKNTATFGADNIDKSATVNVRGSLPGPCPTCNGTFGKSTDWGNDQRNFIVDEAGNIVEPKADIVYTLSAKLSTWNEDSPAQTLTRNVVISDQLAAPAEWSTGTGFITMTGTSPDFTSLTEAAGFTGTADDFKGDAYVGKYAVNGDVLLINVGKNKATDVRIAVKAELKRLSAPLVTNDDAGLRRTGATTVVDGTAFRYRNSATFTYQDGANGSTSKTADIHPVQLPEDRTNGINDSSAFTKDAVDPVLHVDPNAQADVKYKFTINTAKTDPVADLQIVDDFDESYFPLTAGDLAAPNVVVSGSYDGATLGQSDFVLSLVDGDLVIQFSDAGKAKLTATGKQLVVNLTLRTRQLDGKETLAINNYATLRGADEAPDYWSEDDSEATSYDSEIGIEKRVWDKKDAEWTRLLQTGTDANGDMVQNRYIYQVEFRSYDNFTDDAVINVVDQLAPQANFVGFVTSEDPADWSDPAAATVGTLTKDGIVGTYDAGTNRISLSKPAGVWYPVGATVRFRIMVQLDEGSKQVVNGLSWNGTELPPTETVIRIVGQPGIDIEKWNDGEGGAPAYDSETGALTNDGYAGDHDGDSKALNVGEPQQIRFTVSNDGPDRLLDIEVSDQLTGGVGEIADLVCDFPAGGDRTDTTWAGPMEVATQFECTGTVPALQAGQRHSDTATVTAVGEVNGNTVSDSDVWSGHGKSYAVGDYTWIDTNRDGVQDAGEPVLAGVGVELLDADGKVIAKTKTDKKGFYKFDNLEAGTYQVRFTLTEKQAAKYKFTQLNSGDAANDSDAKVGKDQRVGVTKKFVLDDSNAALTTDYPKGYEATEGIDPTWDAGVVEKQYAVGDYVWIDKNGDGTQGKNEPVLPGVKVELLDSRGKVVATTKTDTSGRYLFDELPAGSYQVRFTLTKEQAKKYNFTVVEKGSSANDSNARADKRNPAVGVSKKFVLGDSNTALTHDYDRDFSASEGVDPTWDAGVVEIERDALGETGAQGGMWIAGIGGLGLLLLGLGLMALRRKKLS